MAPEVKIHKTDKADGEFIEFGPVAKEGKKRPRIPASFSRKAVYSDLGLEAELDCTFSGDRIELRRLELRRTDSSISTRDLTQLALPWVIHSVAIDVIPDSYRYSVLISDVGEMESAKQRGPTDEVLREVAAAYWFEHVTWGTPRSRIMEFWGIKRATANEWIRKASKIYALPGAHAGVDGGGEK
jgi:hypothetical protein